MENVFSSKFLSEKKPSFLFLHGDPKHRRWNHCSLDKEEENNICSHEKKRKKNTLKAENDLLMLLSYSSPSFWFKRQAISGLGVVCAVATVDFVLFLLPFDNAREKLILYSL